MHDHLEITTEIEMSSWIIVSNSIEAGRSDCRVDLEHTDAALIAPINYVLAHPEIRRVTKVIYQRSLGTDSLCDRASKETGARPLDAFHVLDLPFFAGTQRSTGLRVPIPVA